jgi:acetylornithine deacetylase/succinyl-diaminopimelate desuccinylase-like protein
MRALPLAPLLALPALLSAQATAARAPSAAGAAPMRAALAAIQRDNAWTLEQQASICEIPAPPFGEAARGAELVRRFEALGLAARTDAVGNVIAERAGAGKGATVVLSAHLDTVFPESTDVKVRRQGGRLLGPGIGDDCRGLAVLLAAAKALQENRVSTPGTIVFVGTVGEEGPGNLRGVRHLLEKEMRGRVDYFISVDGTGLGITSRAVGSNRYRVRFMGPGGHSYGDFGMPNPVHALGRAIAAIADIRTPASPRTTFSVGIVQGGTSVNSIAAEAAMDVDMRSESAAALAALDAQVGRALRAALESENARWARSAARLTLAIDTIGLRPAGTQPDSARIVRVAREAARALGFEVPRTSASSTDSNVPIGMGIPAVTIDGGGRGDGAHSPGEWYDDGPSGWRGPQWAALLAVMLAGGR